MHACVNVGQYVYYMHNIIDVMYIDLCPCSWDSAVAMDLSEEPTESDTPSNVSTLTAQKAGQPTQTDASQGKLNGKEYAPIVIILIHCMFS